MNHIALVIHWDGRPVERGLLESVNACMRHRSPDGSWIWTNGSVGLAQTNLATLPEDEPGVPVVSEQLRIAASCRIDNRDDIKRAIPREFFPKNATDEALILAAYQTWGEDCVNRLIGDFAFIIWDNDKQSIFAARDFYGLRQLHYYCGKNTLFIASDRTQILQDPTVPLEIDEEQIIEYLTPTYQWNSDWEQDLFCGFHVLREGRTLRAKHGQITVRRFWEWRDRGADRRPKKQVLEEYLHTLEEAVRCRLRSRAPVGIELSGGLDSSAVACLAARLPDGSRPELHTFTGVSEFPECDERDQVYPILEQYPQLSPHFLADDESHGRSDCFSADWSPKSIVGLAEIDYPSSRDPFFNLIEESGCRVVLTGWVGDALNQGNRWVYFDLLRRKHYREMVRCFKIINRTSSKKDVLWQLFVYGLAPLFLPSPLLRIGNWIKERRNVNLALPTYFPTPLQKRIRDTDNVLQWRRQRDINVRCPVVRDVILTMFPATSAVTTVFDRPLEYRHPYCDRRLVEMVLSMPQALKWDFDRQDDGGFFADRFHHREAMRDIIPDKPRIEPVDINADAIYRHFFSSKVLLDWLKHSEEVHVFTRGYVTPNLLFSQLMELGRTKSGGDDDDWMRSYNWVMAVLSLEAWLRALAPGGQMHRLIPPRSLR